MNKFPYATTAEIDPRGILQRDWRAEFPNVQHGDVIEIIAPNIAVQIVFGSPVRLWKPDGASWRYHDDGSHLAMFDLLSRGEVRSVRAAAAKVSSDSSGASPDAIVDRLRRNYDFAQFVPKTPTLSSL